MSTIFLVVSFIAAIFAPLFASAGTYYTSISPEGTQVHNPITITFNIQDFAARDYGQACTSGFVPGEIQFNYWFGQGTDFNEIRPAVTPTSAMISSGIYTATFELPVGQEVDSIGAEFFQYAGGGGVKCGFYGNQPNGVSAEPWLEPIFTVASPPPVYVTVGGGVTFQNRAPSFNSVNFPQEAVWAGTKTITYSAVDYDVSPYDLKDFPINFYLSNDGGQIWKEVIKNTSNTGTYLFDTNNFPDGSNYKLKIVALDNKNASGESISSVFAVDNTAPTFEVLVVSGSDVIKEKDKITIKITASENLAETPAAQITQLGAESQPLVVDGSGKIFSATYTVLKGYLGTAAISVKGRDLAGNTGQKIASGETFTVSRLGPPPPVIKNVVDNESFSDPNIDIFGSASLAKEVIFVFNKEKFTVKPEENGDFNFKNLTLSSLDFGRNTLSFSGIDKDGIESDARLLAVKLNSPPKLSWVARPGGLVSGKIKLEWRADDLNNDELVYALWYSVDGGKNWDYFSRGLLENEYELNTAEFFDGDNYLIKVIVDDGTIKSEIVSDSLQFKNNSSFSISNPPKNYIFDIARPVFKGDVIIPANKIASLRYSLEKDIWISAEAVDGKFDSSSEKFSIKFSEPFIDGKHVLFVETKDDQGNVIKTFRVFVVDTAPPVAPKIDSPSPNEIINNSGDRNQKLGGIQANVSGRAEAGVGLELALNNRVYPTVSDSRGEFVFENITFLSHGINRYILSSTDSAGNISKIDGFLISDNVPDLAVLTPQAGDYLQGIKEIKWRASDADDDSLVFQVSYRRRGAQSWMAAGSNLTADSYKLDASKLKEGAYELQVAANDGLAEQIVIEEIFIDNTLPTISFDLAGPLLVSKIRLLFSGSATDNLSGIKFVEYSIDGATWFKALIAEGYLQKKAAFVIRHPFELSDGKYDFGVRAIDAAGNISKPNFEKIIVDSTPPRIGSISISSGALTLFPEEDGLVYVLKDRPYKMLLSASSDAEEVNINAKSAIAAKLALNKSISLWEGEFTFKEAGDYLLAIYARDKIGNSQTRTMFKFRVADSGYVYNEQTGERVEGAKVTAFIFNEADSRWLIWDGEAFGQPNPQTTDANGEYGFLVPAGKYRLEITSSDFEKARTQELDAKKNTLINVNVPLAPKKGIIRKLMEYFR